MGPQPGLAGSIFLLGRPQRRFTACGLENRTGGPGTVQGVSFFVFARSGPARGGRNENVQGLFCGGCYSTQKTKKRRASRAENVSFPVDFNGSRKRGTQTPKRNGTLRAPETLIFLRIFNDFRQRGYLNPQKIGTLRAPKRWLPKGLQWICRKKITQPS